MNIRKGLIFKLLMITSFLCRIEVMQSEQSESLDGFIGCLLQYDAPNDLQAMSDYTNNCLHSASTQDRSRLLKGMNLILNESKRGQKKALSRIQNAYWYSKKIPYTINMVKNKFKQELLRNNIA